MQLTQKMMMILVMTLLLIISSCNTRSEVTFHLQNDLNLPMNQTTTIILENHNGGPANVYSLDTATNTISFPDFPKGTYKVKILNESFNDYEIASLKVRLSKVTYTAQLTTKVGSVIHWAGQDWQVLEKQSDQVLLITQRILGQRRFDESSNIWENSEIRRYLNSDFLNTLSELDQARIVETQVSTNHQNTLDLVWLLSTEEARGYFSSTSTRFALNQNGVPAWWWLRSPGEENNATCNVYADGGIGMSGHFLDCVNGGVRPALWLSLE